MNLEWGDVFRIWLCTALFLFLVRYPSIPGALLLAISTASTVRSLLKNVDQQE